MGLEERCVLRCDEGDKLLHVLRVLVITIVQLESKSFRRTQLTFKILKQNNITKYQPPIRLQHEHVTSSCHSDLVFLFLHLQRGSFVVERVLEESGLAIEVSNPCSLRMEAGSEVAALLVSATSKTR